MKCSYKSIENCLYGALHCKYDTFPHIFVSMVSKKENIQRHMVKKVPKHKILEGALNVLFVNKEKQYFITSVLYDLKTRWIDVCLKLICDWI